ncbi:MAG: alpha/beta hydrolase fold domain-containing protein, partial [Planctomycetaceae bacterium]
TKSWGSSLPRMVTWVKLRDRKEPDGRPVLFFNTHFDHQGEQARLQSARLVRRRLRDQGAGCRLVLTGDFNAGDDQPPYAALFGDEPAGASPVVDTFRVRFPTRGPDEGTFSGFDVHQTRGPRIDWIGASRDWRVEAEDINHAAREGRTPSDHFPVTAVLIPQPADPAKQAATQGDQQAAGKEADPLVAGGPCEVDQELNIAYHAGEGANLRKHKLDLFLPRGRRDFPVLFFIHGGGWMSGDRKLYSSVGRVFARNGVGTAVISYRLTPEVRHPGHIEDVARAFAWVKRNIAERGGRADRIFVAGQSAGGHLSALLATNDRYLRAEGCQLADIRGVIPISGVYDFPRGGFDAVLGTGAEAYDSAIPLQHIGAGCPPFLLLYAESDIPQCDRLSERMCELLQAQQVEARVQRIADRNHISIMFRLMLSTRDPTTQQMLRFIGRHSELELHEQPTAGD